VQALAGHLPALLVGRVECDEVALDQAFHLDAGGHQHLVPVGQGRGLEILDLLGSGSRKRGREPKK
jgi:hypothetical protein